MKEVSAEVFITCLDAVYYSDFIVDSYSKINTRYYLKCNSECEACFYIRFSDMNL